MTEPTAARSGLRILLALAILTLGSATVGYAVWLQLQVVDTYTVVRGDTLSAIGRAHGVSVEDLMRWNQLDSDRIEVGQVLQIHASQTTPPSPGPDEAPPPTMLRAPSSPSARPAKGGRPALTPPPEQPCLDPPSVDEGEGDEAMVASRGLSYDQVRTAMDRFVPETLACVPEGLTPNATLKTEILVACTGRVAHVRILEDAGLPSEMVECVRETLMFAPLPAHDLPNGDRFLYPLTYRF